MKTQIINYIRAGYAGLYLVSPEEQRVEAEIKHIAHPNASSPGHVEWFTRAVVQIQTP